MAVLVAVPGLVLALELVPVLALALVPPHHMTQKKG
jgi:hypothetical protein